MDDSMAEKTKSNAKGIPTATGGAPGQNPRQEAIVPWPIISTV